MTALDLSSPSLHSQYQGVLDDLAVLPKEALEVRVAASANIDTAPAYLARLLSALTAKDVPSACRELSARRPPDEGYLALLHQAAVGLGFGQWEAAIQSAVQASRAPLRNPALKLVVGEAQRRTHAYVQAFHNLSSAADALNSAGRARSHALDCLEHVEATADSQALRQGALAYLRDPERAPQAVAPLIGSLLRIGYPSILQPTLRDFASDELLTTALERVVFYDPEVEQRLVGLRTRVLDSVLRDQSFDGSGFRLVCALARYAASTEHVLFVTEGESSAVRAVVDAIEQMLAASVPTAGIAAMSLLVAGFEPLSELSIADGLRQIPREAWPVSARELMVDLLHGDGDWEAAGHDLPVLGPSQSVAPLRPWGAPAAPGEDVLQGRDPSGKTLLVAGCGSGRRAVQLALRYPELQVLAVDPSRRHLAYARQKAREHGADNLSFALADPSDLPSDLGPFDLIDASELLFEGPSTLASLRAVLAPGGVMQWSLPSRVARRAVLQYRSERDGPLPSSRAEIRSARRELIRSERRPKFTEHPDFFTTSRCRNFLFANESTAVSATELKALLEQHDLDFRGFGFPAESTHREHFDIEEGAEQQLDLRAWSRFESRHPDTFAAGYPLFTSADG